MLGPMRPIVIVRPTWILTRRMEVMAAKLGAGEEQSQGGGLNGNGGGPLLNVNWFFCWQHLGSEMLPVCCGHPGPGRNGSVAGSSFLGSSVLSGPWKATSQSPGAVVGPSYWLIESFQKWGFLCPFLNQCLISPFPHSLLFPSKSNSFFFPDLKTALTDEEGGI